MKGLLKVICLIAVITLCHGLILNGSAQAAMPTVTYLDAFGVGAQMAGPGAIDLDDKGNLYIADGDAGVVKFNKYGTLVGQFTAAPVSGGGLAVSSDGSRVYVSADTDADYGRDQVAILDGDTGAVLGYLGQGAGEFGNAGEIDLDSAGVIYVLDSRSKSIRSYIDDGVGNAIAGESFSVDVAGRLCDLSAMAINTATDEIFVADKKNPAQVRVYTTQAGLLTTYAAASHFGTPMASFRGITFDADSRGYFVDNVNAKIAVLDFTNISGATLASPMGVITLAAVATGASNPQDVVVDSYNRLFVSGGYSSGPSASVLSIGPAQVIPNTPPPTPTGLAPQAGSVVTSARPELTFAAVVDADGDAVTYDVVVTCGGVQVDSATGLTTAAYQVQVDLADNADCSWTAGATDGIDTTTSTPASFFVNTLKERPLVSNLTPDDAAGVTSVSILQWDATDADPGESLTYSVSLDGVSFTGPVASGVALGALAAQAGVDLAPGVDYSWQVKAIDSAGLKTVSAPASFTYANGLVIDSNVPGADVYLGGNPGYLGQLVGQTPYTQINAAAGDYQVAVVHPGFESFFTMVTMADGATSSLVADLVPAVAPAKHQLKVKGLMFAQAGKKKLIEMNGSMMPFMADIDNDGMLDLLVGKGGNNNLVLFRGMKVNGKGNLRFGAKESLVSLEQDEVAPFLADWNNDGLPDLIYGSVDGQVRLVLNEGIAGEPVFDAAAAALIMVGSAPVSAAGSSVPFVVDWNADGMKDLLVGGGNGKVSLYLNVGTDDAPVLQFSEDLFVASRQVKTIPFVSDWDADGDLDLLVGQGSNIKLFVSVDGNLVKDSKLALLDGKGKNANSLKPGSGFFVLDADDRKGKDLLLTDASGQMGFVKSRSKDLTPTFFNVLDKKIGLMADMVKDNPDLKAKIAAAQVLTNPESLDQLPPTLSGLKPEMNADAAATCDQLLLILQ